MELITVIASLLMFFFFIFDIIFKKNIALRFSIISNPYVSGLIMYISIFRGILETKNTSFKLNTLLLLVFLLVIPAVFLGYIERPVSFRPIIQIVQFFLILIVVTFIILASKNLIPKPQNILDSLIISTLLICMLKIFSVALGLSEFNINGQNEDSFLIVIVGLSCGFLIFQEKMLTTFLYFLLIIISLYLYASRAAQVLAFISIIGYLTSVFYAYKFSRIFAFYIVITVITIYVLNRTELIYEILTGVTDLEENHSNAERVAMYLYTFDFLLSDNFVYGLGNVNLAMDDMREAGVIVGEYPHPHSTYLRFALEFGWLGIVGVSIFYLALLYKSRCIYNQNKNLGIIFLIASLNIILFSFVGCVFFSFYRASAVILILTLIISLNKKNEILVLT